MDNLTTMGDRLAYLVRLGGIDYAATDRYAGLSSKGHTGHIARGELVNPTVLIAVRIARVLGTSVEWLVEGGEDAAPSKRRVRAAIRDAVERFEGGHVAMVSARKRARKMIARHRSGRTGAARSAGAGGAQ